MAKNIEPQSKSIAEYLKIDKNNNQSFFSVPEYQRAYSWDKDQCDKLLEDIESFISSGLKDPYFFGTIIIDCSEERENKYSLIDGQQRTTTFLLLLKALLIRLTNTLTEIPNDEDSEGLKKSLLTNRDNIIKILYKIEDEEIPTFLKGENIKEQILIENHSINESYGVEIQKILKAKDFEEAESNTYKNPRKKNDSKKYTKYFFNFKLFYDYLSGKDSTKLNEFSKIFLNLCEVIEIRSWNTEQAITMFNSLNSTGLPLSDADIISAKLFSNSGTEKDDFNKKWEELTELVRDLEELKIINMKSLLNQYMYITRSKNKDYIKNDSVDVSTPALRKYYLELESKLLIKPIIFTDELLKIANIWNKIKDYPIVKIILKFDENLKLYLISYLYRYNIEEIQEKDVIVISEILLKLFAILELEDVAYSSKKFKIFLFGENVKLVDKNISTEEIGDTFSKHVNSFWKEEQIKTRINEYEGNILVYLWEYLYCKDKKEELHFDFNVNVEHVLPTSGRNIESIRKDAGIENQEDFKELVNKLGNKILLEEKKNKSLSNDWFITKKDSYKSSKYKTALDLSIYKNNKWTQEDINKRQEEINDRLANFIFN